MSVIPISTDLAKPSQFVFFRLYLLLKGTSCGETSVFFLDCNRSVLCFRDNFQNLFLTLMSNTSGYERQI